MVQQTKQHKHGVKLLHKKVQQTDPELSEYGE